MIKNFLISSLIVYGVVVGGFVSADCAMPLPPPSYGTGGISGSLYRYYGDRYTSEQNQKIVGSDYNSFVDIDGEYARDTFRGYYRGIPISGSHGSTFQKIGGLYARDERAIYLGTSRILPDINPATVRLVSGYLTDGLNIWNGSIRISGATYGSFVPLTGMFANYAIDTSKQYIYFHSSLLGIYKTLTPISSKLMITAKNIFGPEGRVGSLINTPTTLAAINNNDMQISKSISSYYEQSSLPSYQNESYALDQMIGSYNSIMENSSEYTISEDKYFMYVVSRDDVWYDNYCNDASYQVEPTDVVVMPKQALITVLQRRSSRLSAAQRIDWIQRIQIRLQQQKNLTPQEYALMVSALYVLNQDSIVDCSVWQKASIDRLGLSFEYPECRGNISITEWTQYNYFARLHIMDIIDTKTLSGASLTGYFFEIKFSNLGSNAVMRIENKNPQINYGKLSIGAYLYDYAIRKSTTGGVERIEGVRFFDTCFMGSCGDNELMLNLGVQKKVDKGNGNYGYVIMRFGIINPVTSYSNISDYVAPWFAGISNYAVQWMNNNPRTGMEYRDGYRGDLISNLNSKPTIDLAHTEVINMMKRFYNSIK